jgi:uridine kinase
MAEMVQNNSASFVVAISGPSGSGKTSLVQKVTRLLDDAVSFYFDDYESVSKYPSDFSEWIREGADPNQWETPQLAEDLRSLRYGKAISLPNNRGMLNTARFIVIEEPFGRERDKMNELIDFVACIDLPLEIALARTLLRTIEEFPRERRQDELIEFLRGYLAAYLNGSVRALYLEVNARVLKNCDLVSNGVKPVAELAEEIVAAVKTRVGVA